MASERQRVMLGLNELGYDEERFETTVNRNFHCLICFNVLRDPVMCRRNQHYFCRGCITKHLHMNTRTCPTCADELSVDTLSDAPRIVTDYLDELSIRCDFYERGCRKLVQLQKLKQHVAECGFAPVACGNQGCGEILSKRDRTYHESELCEFRKLKCHNCAEMSAMMAGLETRMATMHAKISNTETNLANVKTKVENMDTKITSIDTKVVNLATNVDTKVTSVDTKVASVDTKVASVDTKVAKFEANVEAKLEAVNNEVRGIQTSLNEVKDGFVHLKEAVVDKMESKERKPEEVARDVSDTASGARQQQYIFVAGGVGRNSVEIFNLRQKLWSSLTSMPEKRWGASSFVYNNHVTVAGGFHFGDAPDSMIQMKIQPIPDLSITWTRFAGKLPAKIYGHSSVVYKDSLYVTGGIQCRSTCIFPRTVLTKFN